MKLKRPSNSTFKKITHAVAAFFMSMFALLAAFMAHLKQNSINLLTQPQAEKHKKKKWQPHWFKHKSARLRIKEQPHLTPSEEPVEDTLDTFPIFKMEALETSTAESLSPSNIRVFPPKRIRKKKNKPEQEGLDKITLGVNTASKTLLENSVFSEINLVEQDNSGTQPPQFIGTNATSNALVESSIFDNMSMPEQDNSCAASAFPHAEDHKDMAANNSSSLVVGPQPNITTPILHMPVRPLRPLAKGLINRVPPWYKKNQFLTELFHFLCHFFLQTDLEGFLFGSGTNKEKELPHDFDIVLENINSEQDVAKALAFIQLLIAQQAIVTVIDEHGNFGYKKNNRYVIPIQWFGWRIEFILFSGSLMEHSRLMDFTVNVLYFSLRDQKMYRFHPLSTPSDLKYKRLRTLYHALDSFTDDPSRIFRGVRLMASEGYVFTAECDKAIRHLFSGNNNLFTTMQPGKFFQQLTLLFHSGKAKENMAIMHSLGIFFKLYECNNTFTSDGGYRFLSRLIPYFNFYTHNQASSHTQRIRFFTNIASSNSSPTNIPQKKHHQYNEPPTTHTVSL